VQSRIPLASSASVSLASGGLAVIGTANAQTGHSAPDGLGNLARIGRPPSSASTPLATGYLATHGFGDPGH